tara:strand:+ start:117 stop:494 length:378 start_codon:yes stop_codon:yes gene_type:complete
MAKDQLRDFHLFAMESALPFGMGIMSNAKSGGVKKIMEICRSNDPFSAFQIDGESSAKIVRDKIDKVFPGLGHPVFSVEVTVEENHPNSEINNQDSLVSVLRRIDTQLDELRSYFSNDAKNLDKQ